MAAEGVAVLLEPGGQARDAGGRVVGDQVAGHEAVDLVPGQDDVSEGDAHQLSGGEYQSGRQVDEERAAARDPADEGDQFLEGEGLWAYCVEGYVALCGGGLHG